MGRKAHATRVDFEMDGILNTDTYYTMEGIMTLEAVVPGLQVLQAKDTSLTSWKENTVGKQHAGHKTVFGFTGITMDRRASNYNKKAGKCPGRSYGESACCKRCQQRRQRPSAMVEYYTGVAARLTQAASIPEDLTDNELMRC
jgi:hypothetical protein